MQSHDRVAGSSVAIVVLGVAAPGATARKREVECEKGYQLYAEGPSILKATWSQVARNPDNVTDELSLTVDRSGTFTTELTKGMESEVGGGFGPFAASVKGQFATTIVRTRQASRGARYEAKVPPRREVRVRYGILTRTYKGIVLADRISDRPEDNPLSPVPLPAGCNLRVATEYSVRAATGEPAFVRSKSRRYTG